MILRLEKPAHQICQRSDEVVSVNGSSRFFLPTNLIWIKKIKGKDVKRAALRIYTRHLDVINESPFVA